MCWQTFYVTCYVAPGECNPAIITLNFDWGTTWSQRQRIWGEKMRKAKLPPAMLYARHQCSSSVFPGTSALFPSDLGNSTHQGMLGFPP